MLSKARTMYERVYRSFFSQITESIALGRSVTAVDSVLRASWKRSWWRANSMSNTFKLVSAAICANFFVRGIMTGFCVGLYRRALCGVLEL